MDFAFRVYQGENFKVPYLNIMELAIFTILKPAKGRVGEIQSLSLNNWHDVFCGADIVEFEGPIEPFDKMVRDVESDSEADMLMYANGDILFDKRQVANLWHSVVTKTPSVFDSDFLLTGQRIDILEDGAKRLHRPSGMDYFVFIRGMFHDLPKVVMGRAYCDNALVAYCLRRSIPVIDASFALRVEHQFHDYCHVVGGRQRVRKGEEAVSNKRENRLCDFGPNVLDATHTLLPDGSVVPNIRRRPKCWAIWNLLTRGGKYWKNPKWDGVEPI